MGCSPGAGGFDVSESKEVESAANSPEASTSTLVPGGVADTVIAADPSQKRDKSGVVYLSTVPPYISVAEVERIMSAYGKVGRIFLRPTKTQAEHGDARFAAKEGWVEFLNKKHAKECVDLLNGETAGMRAPRQWRDAIWNLRYLHRFTWKDLTGYKFMRDFTSKKRLESEVSSARRSTQHYIEKVVMKKKKKSVVVQ